MILISLIYEKIFFVLKQWKNILSKEGGKWDYELFDSKKEREKNLEMEM